MKIPKSQIEWLVARIHVSASDESVRADIRARAEKSGKSEWTPRAIKAAEDYAVKCHEKNRNLYRDVVNGRL